MSLTEEIRTELSADDAARRDFRFLRDENRSLKDEQIELRKMLGFYRSAREAPVRVPTWQVAPRTSPGHHAIVVAQLTDPHFDEVVDPAQVLGLNAYNRAIALTRFRRWTEKVISLPRSYFTGIVIDGLKIFATGDIFTGDIHAELKETNEAKLLASLLYWTEPVIASFEALERAYASKASRADGEPPVSVDAVVGNHGRLSVKPVFKNRAQDNVEWLFWSIIRDRLADRGSKVRVNVSDAMDLDVSVYGRHHLLTHGDQFHGGTGISGAFAPLALGAHRKGVRQQAAGMPMDLMVMGHFHQFLDLPGVIVGGSMKGYDEYAFGLNLRPEPARQALWLTTPERGKTIVMPVELQDREAEGW